MRDDASMPATLDRIRCHLIGLRMPRALEVLDHVVRQVERGEIGTLEAVDALLAEELTIREGRRIKAALQMARLGAIKTLTSFDFSFQPSLDRNRILALAGWTSSAGTRWCTCSARPAPAKATSPSRSASRRCAPGTASTSPAWPTSSPRWPELSGRGACASASGSYAEPRC